MAVRIIGGDWRGRRLPLPGAVRRGFRPSGDKVREALFNCLGQTLADLACLDLFAGSGALGLEAASRGARLAVLVERRPMAAAAIERAAARWSAAAVQVAHSTAARFLRVNTEKFDVIFLDPPFADYPDDDSWRVLLRRVRGHLTAAGEVYCESNRHFAPPPGWRARVARQSGDVCWQILAAA